MDVSSAFTELIAIYKAELTKYVDFLQTSRELTRVLKSLGGQQSLADLLAAQSRIILELNQLDEKAYSQKVRLAQELGLEQLSVAGIEGVPGVEQFKGVLQELGATLRELEQVESENAILLEQQLKALHHKNHANFPKQIVRGAYRKKTDRFNHSFDKKR